MNNPYQSPGSSVEVPEVISKTRWKVLFWLLLILELLSVVSLVLDDSESIFDLVFEIVIYTAVLSGVFGYAYNKRILNQKVWKPVLPVTILFDIYYIFLKEPLEFSSNEEMLAFIAIFSVVFLPLIFFQYLALYRYAFRAREIWDQRE